MAQYTFTRDSIQYIVNISPDIKNNSIPDSVVNQSGTWLLTVKDGTNKVWFKTGFQDKSNIKTIETNFDKFVYYISDGEVISESNFKVKWNDETQYDLWYGINNLNTSIGDDINKRFINGLLEHMGHVDAETGEGYLFNPITLEPLNLDV